MSRIGTGIRLAKASWRVIREEKSLVAFPLLSAGFAILYLLIIVLPLGLLGGLVSPVLGYAIAAVLLIGTSIGSTFFGVATAANAARVFEGQDPTIGDGIAVARSRLGVIVKWGIVQGTVGLILRVIGEQGGVVGSILQVVGGVAWTIASFFALPILALEGLGPIDTLKKSAGVVRQKWGEALVGGAAVGLITGLVAFAGIGIVVLGVLTAGGVSWFAGVPLIIIGLVVFVVAIVVGALLRAVFTVAVYRFATAGAVAPGFDVADLEQAFRPKRGSI